MTRAIITCMHAYTPFGTEFYQPILDHFLKQLEEYSGEWDHLYLIEDDNWKLDVPDNPKITVVHVDSSLRYYDAYKAVLPQVKEDLVLFMDDDMVVYKKRRIAETFELLYGFDDGNNMDVVSIIQSIGTMEVPLEMGNKFSPFFFATRKDLLMKYLDVDWSPDAMPYTETFGLLTEAMLKDGTKVYELEDDASEVISWDPLKTEKYFGYYHVRSGSETAILLASKKYGHEDFYWKYIKEQPKEETKRHCDWYAWMGGDPSEVLADL